MQIGHQVQRRGAPQRLTRIVLNSYDPFAVWVHYQLDGLAGQFIGHLKLLTKIRHGAVLFQRSG